jgi:uncharacterized membrane protein YtjA (UPF0391 family)
MDEESELRRAKWLLLGIVIFLVSGCISYRELLYYVTGHNAQGQITKTYESVRRSRGRETISRVVEYSFSEPDGTQRSGSDDLARDWPIPVDGKVMIRYTPGSDGSSRISGHVNWVGPILFAISLVLVIVFLVKLLIEASQATRELRRGPRRRRKRKRYTPPRDY